MAPHPLAPLSEGEFTKARDAVVKLHGSNVSLFFRSIYLYEPKKADLIPFLQAEHAGTVTEHTRRPPRLANVQYDVISSDNTREYTKSLVDVNSGDEVEREAAPLQCQTNFALDEFAAFQPACVASQLFKDAMAEFALPEKFVLAMDSWPYGGPDFGEEIPRLMQGLVFARDTSSNNRDSNHYGYPIPIIPVMDMATKEIIRVDRLATGGAEDGLSPFPPSSKPKKLFHNSKPAEYAPELIDRPLRTDLKPINITQPEGPSFKVYPDNLVEWQKWRFRIGFTPREGVVIHDVCYDNRPILYRLSYSELTVPYADPRPPYHRKQAFDLGDGGFGRAANNLELGCDCLGAIHYFDTLLSGPDGSPMPTKAVVCLHEQDNGIGWKHTNYRTERAVVTRLRELVVQCVVTLANYEYVIAYKLDTAGGITVETRATGIVSVVGIDEGKNSKYGTVVGPGVLAQNHQHVFAVRIDPAIDSYASGDTAIVVEESVPVSMNPTTNPHGNFYEVKKRMVEKACWIDAEPKLNRVIRFENTKKKNEVSGRPVGFKLTPPATQLLLADESSTVAQRAAFAQHHVWVTGHRDGELWAAGEYTNQSKVETGGVKDMVSRGDWFGESNDAEEASEEGRKSSPVVWSVFGLTHNPRVEDWPVMPVEIHHINIRPADFFTSNPALDVPGIQNKSSVIVPCCAKSGDASLMTDRSSTDAVVVTDESVQKDPLTHLQGSGPDINPEEVGAHVDHKPERRLSRTLMSVFGWKGNGSKKGPDAGASDKSGK